MRRAYANSPKIGVAEWIHFWSTWGGEEPSIDRVITSGWKVAKGGRSRSQVSPWNLAVNWSRTTFVAGLWHIM